MKMERPPIGKSDGSRSQPLKDTAEGFRMARNFAPSRYLLMLIASTGFFCFPSIVLMPAMAKSVLGGTSETLGFLLMGVAIGALAGSFIMASLKSSDRLYWWCTRACLAFGVSVVFFSLSGNIYAGIALAAPVGFCMVTSTISCNTLLQSMVPAGNRSRIMALYTMAILGIPPFGSLLSGRLADHLGTDWALFICGSISAVIAYYFLRKIDRIKDQISKALEDPRQCNGRTKNRIQRKADIDGRYASGARRLYMGSGHPNERSACKEHNPSVGRRVKDADGCFFSRIDVSKENNYLDEAGVGDIFCSHCCSYRGVYFHDLWSGIQHCKQTGLHRRVECSSCASLCLDNL